MPGRSSAPSEPIEPACASAAAPLLLLLAAPRGFCAGVRRAIEAVEDALDRFGAPVYVRRPIVHNLAVVRALEAKGAIFVEELEEVPEGAVVIMSAHGISRAVAQEADRRALRWFDAVCPLVAKVHREVVRHNDEGRHVILIGHADHPEIEGTLGQLPDGAASVVASREAADRLALPDGLPVAYAVQTTYSVEDASQVTNAILERFRDVQEPPSSDICFATTNRQAGVRAIAARSDAVIVAGEHFSSNATRLAEVARASGCDAVQLVADASHVDWSLLSGARTVGLTAAASTPEQTITGIIDALRRRFDVRIEEAAHAPETAVFKPLRFD
jgi:4-hydroxy-3-methylbut-2-en-1-yl diphosphate reductase